MWLLHGSSTRHMDWRMIHACPQKNANAELMFVESAWSRCWHNQKYSFNFQLSQSLIQLTLCFSLPVIFSLCYRISREALNFVHGWQDVHPYDLVEKTSMWKPRQAGATGWYSLQHHFKSKWSLCTPWFSSITAQQEKKAAGGHSGNVSWQVFLKVQFRDINGAFAVVKIISVQEGSPCKCPHCYVGIGPATLQGSWNYRKWPPWQPLNEECPACQQEGSVIRSWIPGCCFVTPLTGSHLPEWFCLCSCPALLVSMIRKWQNKTEIINFKLGW